MEFISLAELTMNTSKNMEEVIDLTGSDTNPQVKNYQPHYYLSATASEKTLNKCGICQIYFASEEKLFDHKKTMHLESHMCVICSSVFYDRHHLTQHLQSHRELETPPKAPKLSCDDCQQLFDNSIDLFTHRQNLHPKIFQCNKCDRTFYQERVLKLHTLVHDISVDEPPNNAYAVRYGCNFCKNTFHTYIELKTHEKSHPKCAVCQRQFSTQSFLSRHESTHRKQLLYECDICEMKFGILERLQKHFNTHADQIIHNCKICFLNFESKHALGEHIQGHQVNCELCGAKFRHKGLLALHLKKHLRRVDDSASKMNFCQACGVSFSCGEKLAKHQKMHMKIYRCDLCEKAFCKSRDLRNHNEVDCRQEKALDMPEL